MSNRRADRRPSTERPWSVPVAVAEIPETGRHIDLAPDEATRRAVAAAAGVVALPRLEASFDLARHGSAGLRVSGRLEAAVEQHCVVTLEPLQNEVDEAIDLLFTPPRAPEASGVEPGDAVGIDEPPETLRDGTVDLGALATEFLILAIDPYPRKPDAVFDAPPVGDPGAHPFAALAALKKGQSEKDP